MSGNAALSAARKRRASASPSAGAPGSINTSSYAPTSPTNNSYYSGNSIQNIQAMMSHQVNQNMPRQQQPIPSSSIKPIAPNIPINIYENIEMIKEQIEERSNIIKTKRSTLTPEQIRELHKRNEIQTQILKQRIMMVQEMEASSAAAAASSGQRHSQSVNKHTTPSVNEPAFTYEKGIPRPNPRYNPNPNPNPNGSNVSVDVQQPQSKSVEQQQQQPQQQQFHPVPNPTAVLTPFISMITNTGVTPPPIVILKSHDEKIGEHDAVLTDLTNRMNYIHSRIDELSYENETQHRGVNKSSNIQTWKQSEPVVTSLNPIDEISHGDHDGDHDGEPESDETVLLMEAVMNDLTNSREFVQGIVDKIVNETNLSETILKIEPIIKENQELRSLIHSQQKMMNELNTMVLRLLNQTQYNNVSDNNNNEIDDNGLYQNTTDESTAPPHIFIVPSMDNIIMNIEEHHPQEYEYEPTIHNDDDGHGSQEDNQEVQDDQDNQDNQDNQEVGNGSQEDNQEVQEVRDDGHGSQEESNNVDETELQVEPEYEIAHFPSDSRIALVVNEI
jgi:hypothetical protein